MALSRLTPRQETAARLCRELQAFGATVTSVMPLEQGRHLRFWCSDYAKNELMQLLKDAGYQTVFLGMDPQFCTRSQSQGLVNRFEVILPAERQPIPQEGRKLHSGEIVKPEKTNVEVEGIKKYLGLK